jgi:hypothetical protein
LSYSTASNPFRAQVRIIGSIHRAARFRLAAVLMSIRYSPPQFGSSPSVVSTRSCGHAERSSRRLTPGSSSCVWNALT